jgi:hypothetical protein
MGKLPFIIFELIKFPILKQTGDDKPQLGPPVESAIVIMDVMPTRVSYKYGSKKSYIAGLGDNNVLAVKGGVAPIKINFSGTFGQRWATRGIQVQNGFGRLKEFRNLYLTSQSVNKDLRKVGEEEYIYGLNFYDFTMHYWGSVDLDTFDIDNDAAKNSKTSFYNVSMTGMGELIDVKTSDPILRNLKFMIKVQEAFDKANSSIENFLKTNVIASTINEIIVDLETYNMALDMINEMSATYLAAIDASIIGDVANIISTQNLTHDPMKFKNDFLRLIS